MRLPYGNISTAHLSVPYNELIHQHDSLVVSQLEITVRCLNPDDFVRHDNGWYCQLKRKSPGYRLLRALPATNNQGVTAQ